MVARLLNQDGRRDGQAVSSPLRQNQNVKTATMPLLTIHHKTEYRYRQPVIFGEHRMGKQILIGILESRIHYFKA